MQYIKRRWDEHIIFPAKFAFSAQGFQHKSKRIEAKESPQKKIEEFGKDSSANGWIQVGAMV